MKKLVLLFVFAAFTSFMSAQTTPVAPAKKEVAKKETTAKPKQVANPAAYACMKCYNIEKAAGKCSKCQGDKVQLGTYYCEHCAKATGAKAGKCDMCGAKTTQMTRKFCGSKTSKDKKTEEAPAHKKAA